ncbi:MAG TPA: class II aldolase/adducin family protein [Pseudonocardiaceae bacterium]|jgi:rhamnose utilization protein RhaD (predicted bifunctional aldolase and dehydrogenase)
MDGFAQQLFVAPTDGWTPQTGPVSARDEVIFRAHLVGGDPALTKEGGGNFSVKGTAIDHRGEPTRVLWMSAWGCDGAVTTQADFPALRLDDLLLLRDSGPVSETRMIEHLVASGLTGEQARPGIETLTHAFIPATHVDHCHPDAVIALTSFPGAREIADEEFGEEAIWFDYRQFDVGVARELADRIAANPRCRFVLLANHGLFTWAETSEQCYRNSLEAVARSTSALAALLDRPADLGGTVLDAMPTERATEVLTEVLPVLRGALGTEEQPVVLHVNRDTEAVDFTRSARGLDLSQRGPSCPDHVVTVGHRPLVLAPVDEPATAARTALDGIAAHRTWYDECYRRYVTGAARELGKRDNAPKAVVLPGIAVVCAAPDAAKARLCDDHFGQTRTVVRAADAAGGYVTLTEEQSMVDEYWPLMRLKPQLRRASGCLAGQVFLVSGLDDADTIELVDRLAAHDAHIAFTGADPRRMTVAAEEICHRHGERRAVALASGPWQAGAVVRDAVLTYGGFDTVVDLTATGETTLAALPVFARQGHGGRVLLAEVAADPGRLGPALAALANAAAQRVSVNAIASTLPSALAEAAVFFAASRTWQGALLQPYRELETGVA